MGTATFIRRLDGYRGDARVFALDPPFEGETHVVVSAVDVLGRPETYIFPADAETGEVSDWGELSGSQKDTLSHEEVLAAIGYTIDGDVDLAPYVSRPLSPDESAFTQVVDALGDVLGYVPGGRR